MYPLRINNKYSPIITKHNFLTNDEIGKVINLVSGIQYERGLIYANTNQKNKIKSLQNYFYNRTDSEYRKSKVKFMKRDNNSEWLYDKIIKSINEVNSLNYNYILSFLETIQFSNYCDDEKSYYKGHYDSVNPRDLNNFEYIRKLSFSIQLSDENEYSGGELKICTESDSRICDYNLNKKELDYFTCPKDKGTIAFFPSNFYHEVTPVIKGNRYSLVGWIVGPNVI